MKLGGISMIEQVLPRIYHIRVPLPGNPLRELNSYLLKGDGHNLLIDTGFRQPPCQNALQSALDELGIRREETDVLITHLHSDHSGMADLFAGDDRHIYISGIDRNIIDGPGLKETRAAQDARYQAEGFGANAIEVFNTHPARSMAVPEGITNYHNLQDGDTISVAGYTLKAIHTPGHTPGHMCFWLEEQGAMFLGDHVLFDITPNITAWHWLPDSLGAYFKSLKAIRAYDVEIPLPAHRAPGNFKDRIDQILVHHQHRLDETLQIVRANPGRCAYDIASKMTWSIRCTSWEDFPAGQKFFAVGECMSHLDHLMVLGEVKMEMHDGLKLYYTV